MVGFTFRLLYSLYPALLEIMPGCPDHNQSLYYIIIIITTAITIIFIIVIITFKIRQVNKFVFSLSVNVLLLYYRVRPFDFNEVSNFMIQSLPSKVGIHSALQKCLPFMEVDISGSLPKSQNLGTGTHVEPLQSSPQNLTF